MSVCGRLHNSLPELLKTQLFSKEFQLLGTELFPPVETKCKILHLSFFVQIYQLCVKVIQIGGLMQVALFLYRLSWTQIHYFVCIDITSVATSFSFFISVGVQFFLQAPAVDVVAIGLVSGHIIVHNIKFDETLMKFQQDWGPITAISFRTGKSQHFY